MWLELPGVLGLAFFLAGGVSSSKSRRDNTGSEAPQSSSQTVSNAPYYLEFCSHMQQSNRQSSSGSGHSSGALRSANGDSFTFGAGESASLSKLWTESSHNSSDAEDGRESREDSSLNNVLLNVFHRLVKSPAPTPNAAKASRGKSPSGSLGAELQTHQSWVNSADPTSVCSSGRVHCGKNRSRSLEAEPPLISVDDWYHSYRLSNVTNGQLGLKVSNMYYPFARNEESCPEFVKQLIDFREDLAHFEGKPIESFMGDFVPPLTEPSDAGIGVQVDGADEGKPLACRPKEMTKSRPWKLVEHVRQEKWTPVSCSTLKYKFVHEGPHSTHDPGRNDGKARNGLYVVFEKDLKTRYLRKVYHDPGSFYAEHQFFQYIHHPYLIKPVCFEHETVVFDSNGNPIELKDVSGRQSIVMEYFEGDHLNVAVEKLATAYACEGGNTPETWKKIDDHIFRLLAKVMIALHWIHMDGLVHCDVKPENVLLNVENGNLKLIDYDMSVFLPYLLSRRGTWTTIAPELTGKLKGPTHFGVDWWSFGSTSALVFAAAYAAAYRVFSSDTEEAINALHEYVPFGYSLDKCKYEVTKLPAMFPPSVRQFLYPFFNPNPGQRAFNHSHIGYKWLKEAPAFRGVIENWQEYEWPNLGDYANKTPQQLNFEMLKRHPFVHMREKPRAKTV